MKNLIIGALAAGMAISPALANEVENFCVGFAAENELDDSGCSCLGGEADKNVDVATEILGVESTDDLETLSEASQKAIGECFPDSEAA